MFPIQVMRLRSAVPVQINIFDQTLSDIEIKPANAVVIYQLTNSGIGSATGNANWTWKLYGLNSDYQVRATLLSGSAPTGGDVLNSWLSLGSTRNWSLTRGVVGVSTGSILVEIRRVVDSIIVDSATISMDAEVDSGL